MKKINDKISVIIPVYNSAEFLKQSLSCVLSQTYPNIEIIIIDDGSTDDSCKIIEELIKDKKNAIFVKNEFNKGAAYTRNLGISLSTGQYIGFVDSDDYICNNYYELLYESIKKNKSDIAICDIKLVNKYDNKDTIVPCYNEKLVAVDIINTAFAASSCNKLFKKDILEKYPYPEGIINEDIVAIIPTIINSNKIAYVPDLYYEYIVRENSVQNSKFNDKKFEVFIAIDKTLSLIKNNKKYLEYKDALIFNQLILFLYYIIQNENSFIKRYNIISKYSKLIKKYNILNNKELNKFLSKQGKIHRLYYKYLTFCVSKRLNLFGNILISFYHLYKKYMIKNVIKKSININDIKKLALKQSKKKEKISISAIIPNYNYKKFLYQRLYSVLLQDIKLNEIIILDDCSTDGSREEIDKIVNELKDIISIKSVYNETNSGSAFKQWQKGFELAKSDYVWIAEADDYCSKKMLTKLVNPIIKDKDIIISYADTAFIDIEGNIITSSIKSEIDVLKTGHWDNDYVNDGKEEFNNYSYLNCTIANVSSTLIRKDNYSKYFKLSGKYKQCGDWLFYSNVMQLGKVAFCKESLNYYRFHGSNVTSVTKKEAHMKEMKQIHEYYDKTYGLNKEQKKNISDRYEFLKTVWRLSIK